MPPGEMEPVSMSRQWEEAKEMHREVLEGRRRKLGQEHEATLCSMNNLASP